MNFELALVRDPQHGDATFRLAFLHLERGEYRRALALFDHYLELESIGRQAEAAAQAAALCRRQLAPELEVVPQAASTKSARQAL
jgi:hypothetical protein